MIPVGNTDSGDDDFDAFDDMVDFMQKVRDPAFCMAVGSYS